MEQQTVSNPVQFHTVSERHELTIFPGPGGWADIDWRPNTETYVRFALNPDRKTVRIVDLRMPNPTSEALRSLPLARIETAANASIIVMLAFAGEHLKEPPADIPGFFRKRRTTTEKASAEGRFILQRPEGRRLNDGFYIRVAQAYRDALARGQNPRPTIAADTHSAVDTVARWIGEARRRGHLPPTTPGKKKAFADDPSRV